MLPRSPASHRLASAATVVARRTAPSVARACSFACSSDSNFRTHLPIPMAAAGPAPVARPATPLRSGVLSAAAGLPSRILVLTTYDPDTYLYQAILAGAGGFCLKDVRRDELMHAIRTVAAGDTLLHPTLTRRLLERFTASPPPGPPPTKRLGPTEREAQALSLVGQGLSNSEIADALFLGESTVKTHLNNLMRKLDLRDRVQAVVFAYESGLIRPGANPS